MEENKMPTNADLSIQISEIKKMMDEATLKLQQTLLELNQAKESRNGYRDEQFAEIRNMLLNPSQINPPPAFEPLSSLVNPESVETAEIKTNDVDTAVSTEEEVLEEKDELQTLGNVSYVQIESTDSQFTQDEANVTGNQLNIPLLDILSDDEYMDPYLHASIDGLKILDIICTPTVCRNASMDLSLHYASLSLKCSQYNLIIFMPWTIMHIDLDKPPPLPPETMQDECYSSMQCIKSCGSRNGSKVGSHQYHCRKNSDLLMPSDRLRFLNKACIIRSPEQDVNRNGLASNPWRLCTVDQVEELKALLKVLPLWSTGIMLSVNMNRGTSQLLQANSMDRHISTNFQLPAGSFGMFAIIALAAWVALYDRVILPLASKVMRRRVTLDVKLRMGIGLFLSFMSMIVSGIVENIKRKKAIHEGYLNNAQGVVNMLAFWLVPQYILGGLAEAFQPVTVTVCSSDH